MSYDINNSNKRQNNRAFAGMFLVLLGGIYLLRQLDFFFFPGWLFSWPMILIVIGIATGIKHNFTRPGSYIMIFIGSVFLLTHIIGVTIYYFWPLIMICIGLSMVFGRNHWARDRWDRRNFRHHADDNSINL